MKALSNGGGSMTDNDRLKEIARLTAALKEIRDKSIVDLMLDPDWPRRIASKALEKLT